MPTRPDWCPADRFSSKPVPDSFFDRRRYRFSLLANPTKKVSSNKTGKLTKNGRRVALTKREDLIAWLNRKADEGGFVFNVDSLRTITRGPEYFHKRVDMNGIHTAVEFQGVLTVRDPVQFRSTVARGIGSAKAFGFGLLILAPLS